MERLCQFIPAAIYIIPFVEIGAGNPGLPKIPQFGIIKRIKFHLAQCLVIGGG